MTEYHEFRDGSAVTDSLHTNGIVSEDFFDDGHTINWQTGVSPSILRDIADLAEFCYGAERDPIDVGLVESPHDDERVPVLVLGRAEDDRYVMAAPRQDCHVGPNGDGGEADE